MTIQVPIFLFQMPSVCTFGNSTINYPFSGS
ncbi:hypothetical protein OOU_Y34scaffold00776g1 [Pyricularia oryzae Y34]|uniref:Uncharacterized protein n=1 Tax=Pyricularia oryzae (strain Y34) TaxID=1143189 RepID=A0AA97NQ78_PYRO3|nr:hypothetical protein OOU_Y34scaffold00776g1 [Pyricularia oryzae Y34]